MGERRRFDRRTGLVVIALAVVSNFLPWMELMTGQTATFEAVGPRELAPGVGLCLAAALLVAGAWLLGRRQPPPSGGRLADPRRAGLRAALATCAVNGLLTAAILFLRTREIGLFAFLWCLVALPVQVAAAFAFGRASAHSPGRRRTTGDVPTVSP
jgi:hypothetical protein